VIDFKYPPRIRRVVAALWILLLLFNVVEYLLAWARALYVALAAPLGLLAVAFLAPIPSILPMLLTAHIGLAFAILAARGIAFLAPRVALWSDALVMRAALGARVIPFSALRGIRSFEFASSGRFVVWVESKKGLPLQNLIASLLFGRWLDSGFLLTSDLAGFDDILAAIVAELKQRYGEPGFAAHVIEEPPTWLAKMIFAPLETLREASDAHPIPISQSEAMQQMISVAASLALPLLVAAIIHLQIPWGALVLPLFALIEFPLASLFLALAPVEPLRPMEFQDALRLYPASQLPRWVIAAGFAGLIIAGAPFPALILLAIPAIVLGCYWVLKMTEDWYAQRVPDALIGLVVTGVFQFILYALFLALLPR
jgi:hypothetical protein